MGRATPLSLLATPASTRAVGVYPLVPSRSFDDPLTYALPDGLAGEVRVGSLVEVPLGTAGRVGVVAALDVPPPEGVELREVVRVLSTPPVPPALVSVAEWIAEQYGCAKTVALALVVPPRLAAHARATEVPVRRRQQAIRRSGDPASGDGLSQRLRTVAAQLPEEWTAVAELADRLGTTRASLAKLAALGMAELEERFVEELATEADVEDADAWRDVPAAPEAVPVVQLSAAQQAAVDVCEQASGAAEPGTVLRGITGSGKTEVYLELIERSLARGAGAIVLVPEISLTPQTARRFLQRFPGDVEVLHSGLTRAERGDAWERIASGEARVVIGPRSAIFAPLANLGVVVVDEEHDGSYKQDSDPRYDARRVAWKRALEEGAVVVYGSATPRPESWHAVRRRAILDERAGGGRLAPIELVDLRDAAEGYPLTERVADAIQATIRRGRKVIVLHNRRGYATALQCHTCGHSLRCPNCDVSLVVHGRTARAQRLTCHHCGYADKAPDHCPSCSAADIARMGAGTERLERDLDERFGVPVLRLDADATRTRGSVGEILRTFSELDGAAILTGTQMVAKGHDFPDVELAVVVDADTALAIPDFRAEERAFSLVAQLAGRAGRSAATAEHARVVVQSWDPEQEFLAFARSHDVEGFLERELERRRQLRYPPFTRLVRVLLSALDEGPLLVWGEAVADGLRRLDVGTVLGPAQLLRLSGRQRAQLIVKTNNPAAIADAMRAFLRRTAADRSRADVRVVLDVDPQTVV